MTLKYWVWFSGLCMCIGKRLGVIDLWFWRIKAWDIYQLKIYQNLAPFSPTWRLTQFDKFRLFKIYESRLKRLKTLENLSKLKNFALCWWQVAQCDAWGIFCDFGPTWSKRLNWDSELRTILSAHSPWEMH